MKKYYESCIVITVVIIVSLIFILINFSDVEEFVTDLVVNNDIKNDNFFFKSDWFPSNLDNTKYINKFKFFEKICLNTLPMEIGKKSNKVTSIAGVGAVPIENKTMENFFKKSIIQRNLVFFIKANKNHHIPRTKLQYIHKFDDGVKQASHVMYCFGDVDWKFKDGWLFKKFEENQLDRYYFPENNSIICFDSKSEYELKPLKSTKPRYFMMILIFG